MNKIIKSLLIGIIIASTCKNVLAMEEMDTSQDSSQPTQEINTYSTDSRMTELEHAISQGNNALMQQLILDGASLDPQSTQQAIKRHRIRMSSTVAALHQTQNPFAAIPNVTFALNAMEDSVNNTIDSAKKACRERNQAVTPLLHKTLGFMPATVVAIIASYKP